MPTGQKYLGKGVITTPPQQTAQNAPFSASASDGRLFSSITERHVSSLGEAIDGLFAPSGLGGLLSDINQCYLTWLTQFEPNNSNGAQWRNDVTYNIMVLNSQLAKIYELFQALDKQGFFDQKGGQQQ